MTGAVLAKPVDTGRCAAVTGRAAQCSRNATTVVPGVDRALCRQHARIVATEPGAAGVTRPAPQGVTAIVTELAAATTKADIDRCRAAIASQIDVCHDPTAGLRRDVVNALQAAKARVAEGERR